MKPIQYRALQRSYLPVFIERSFLELNPQSKFYPNWHIDLVADSLMKCQTGKITRLIINVPPRSLKSHAASVAFPAFLLGHNPSIQIICASYAQDLADKHARDSRTLMNSAWYKNLFLTQLGATKQAVGEFITTKGGGRLATSVGGVLTGRGADFIIIDDPIKPDDAISDSVRNSTNQWFDNTVISRLNDKRKGCIIIIMQRLHEDDLVGHVIEQGGWTVLRFPAIAEEEQIFRIPEPFGRSRRYTRRIGDVLHPEREPLERLNELRKVTGEYNFAGQYQQSPAPFDGGTVKRAWFRAYDDKTLPAKFDLVFQSWDTANKASELNDYSVCTTWGYTDKDKKLYLRHVLRMRLEYPDLKRTVRSQANLYSATNVLIEDKASGTQLIQELRREGMNSVTKYTPLLEKVLRMHSVTPTIEGGFVYIPEKAEWLAVYLHELTTFPSSKYDDQADSTSQALDWIKKGYVVYGLIEYLKQEASRTGIYPPGIIPDSVVNSMRKQYS